MSDLESLEKQIQECQMILRFLLKNQLSDDPEAYIDLGIEYGQLELYKESYEMLTRAIELAPDNPDAHYNLGVLYSKIFFRDISKEELWEDLADDEFAFEIAVKEFQNTINLADDYIEAYNDLGILYKIRHLDDQAKEMFEKSLELDPDQEDIKEELDELT